MSFKMYWESFIPHPDDDTLLEEWKAIYDGYIAYLTPNKKNGWDVLAYIRNKYQTEEETEERVRMVVEMNALGHRPYLPEGIFDLVSPYIIVLNIKNEGEGMELYKRQQEDFWELAEQQRRMTKDIEYLPEDEFPVPVFIGVEINSGYVYVEGSPTLADEITMLQGLNEKELQNIYLVAHYIQILKKNGNLSSILK